MQELFDKIEAYGFECQGGPLSLCQEWINLKEMFHGAKTAYAVIGNTDLTEGRGDLLVKAICELPVTANRLGRGGFVQGTACPIDEVLVFRYKGRMYGPVSITPPSKDDEASQKRADAKAAVLAKARASGLTEDELKLLQSAA